MQPVELDETGAQAVSGGSFLFSRLNATARNAEGMPAVARSIGMARGRTKTYPQIAVLVDFSNHEDFADARSHFCPLDRW
nr:hypothetical protein [uncultured Albidiferax sp.]